MPISTRAAGWSWLLSIPLAAGLFYWSVRGVAWRLVWSAIAGAKPTYLLAAATTTATSYFLRGVRWRILLNAEGSFRVSTVFWANMAGYLGNNFLPARAGEVLRSVLISSRSKLSKTYVLTTALSERLMDVIAVVLAAALALLGVHPKPRWMTDVSGTLAVVALGGAAALAILPHTGGLVEHVLGRLPLPAPLRRFLMTTTAQVLLGIRVFHHWGRLAGFWSLTAVIWSIDAITVILGARALEIGIPIPAAVLLLTAMALGSALPSTPGYVGIYQFAAVTVLMPFGIVRDQALAYSLVGQAIGYVVVAALGLPALYFTSAARKPEGAAANT